MSDAIYIHCRDFEIIPSKDVINQAYRFTKRGSLLRALFGDIMVYERTNDSETAKEDLWYADRLDEFHSEFRDDVLVEVMTLAGESAETVDDALSRDVLEERIEDCYHHVHDLADNDSNPKSSRSDTTGFHQVVFDRKVVFR
jgi:hypothetical protein